MLVEYTYMFTYAAINSLLRMIYSNFMNIFLFRTTTKSTVNFYKRKITEPASKQRFFSSSLGIHRKNIGTKFFTAKGSKMWLISARSLKFYTTTKPVFL